MVSMVGHYETIGPYDGRRMVMRDGYQRSGEIRIDDTSQND